MTLPAIPDTSVIGTRNRGVPNAVKLYSDIVSCLPRLLSSLNDGL